MNQLKTKFGRSLYNLMWITKLEKVTRFVLSFSIFFLLLLLLFIVIDKWSLYNGTDLTMNLFDVLFAWIAYGAFYMVVFVSLPAFIVLVTLYILLKKKVKAIQINVPVKLAIIHLVLIATIIVLVAYT